MVAAARVRSICRCPACLQGLVWNDERAVCSGCAKPYRIVEGVPVLLVDSEAAPILDERWYTGAKSLLPERYWPLVDRYRNHLRPGLVHKTRTSREQVIRFAGSFGPDATILNIGSGETELGSNVINLDIEPAEKVHVVGIAEQLPFADSSCSGVMLMAVLEHVADADRTLREVRRVLVPGGRVLIDVPFMQGYHASPADHRRYTEQGLHSELERYGFEVEGSGVAVGPASGMAWISAEFLALLLSFQSARAYRLVRLATTWVVWPIKFTDAWLERHPMGYTIASSVWAIGRLASDGDRAVEVGPSGR
jgi:SAM-dependent methyltransferase